jgi:glycosyltransferase involved in cell wall biosynthesis
LHDVSIFEIGKMFMHSAYGFFGLIWKKLLFIVAAKSADRVLTVSRYSKIKLNEILKIPSDRISIVYNAWQHYERLEADECIIEKLGLPDKGYFFSLSSLSPQKNFVWIKEVAKRNPDLLFIVTGKAEGFTNLGAEDLKTDNLRFTGYLSDEEIKALMKHCRAFIHPAIYEGFGIPPLEAMSCGAEIIVSTATCLPEIYGKAAHYIDPHDYDVDLNALLKEPVAQRESVLERFEWQCEAEKLLLILRR